MILGIIFMCAVANECISHDVNTENNTYANIIDVLDDYGAHRTEADRTKLAGYIYAACEQTEVAPPLLLAMISVESSFRKNRISRHGAIGLMQLLPGTAKAVANKHGVPWVGVETLKNPEHNILLGAYYLRRLLDRFDNDLTMAITAYNAGPTRTMKYIRKGRMYSQIYTKKVLKRYGELSTYF